MRFGVHMSISGGMEKMARAAIELGCETVQIFSRSPRGGKARPLDPRDVARMKQLFQEHDIGPLVIHAPYYLNLASADEDKRSYSIEVLAEDLTRAEILGADFVVTHIGHRDRDESDGSQALRRVIDSINEVLGRYSGPVKLLLENTAGQGRELGSHFEELGKLVHMFPRDRVGTCFDTSHAFGRGYDLSDPEAVDRIFPAYDRLVGLDTLEVIHLNDSKHPLGSRKDRHAHIGQGGIGLEGFRAIINYPGFGPDMPGIMETPTDTPTADADNLATVRALRNMQYDGGQEG
ncbi:MAG: deoxyribonuclease IV [Bacillota bacterium]|nr:deoxyribonuclease IV [Candidatus Fermentithermobacillaceae bacterium]